MSLTRHEEGLTEPVCVKIVLAPRLLYLCPKGKASVHFWLEEKVWRSSNQKNIASKRVQEMADFPEIPGNPNWSTCNIILMTINEAYLVALSATVTSNYIPMMTPGLLDTFPGAS